MEEVTKVKDVLQKGETAVVIFTRGHDTEIYDDGSAKGFTGYWKMNPERKFDKVVLYWREDDENQIYVTDFDSAEEEVNGRCKLFLSNIRLKAKTSSNWWTFTGNKGSNPVKYITA